MKTNNKWTVKDVITTVLLTVVLIGIHFIVITVSMVNQFFNCVLSPGVSMFFSAPVYILMVSRINKRFVSLASLTILGLVYLLTGNWYLLPYFALLGLLCEVVLWKRGSYRNAKRLTFTWSMVSLFYIVSNLLPLWFFWDTFYAFAVASGMDQSYIDSYIQYYTSPGWLIFIVSFSVICGFLGSILGSRLIGKHFKKAGVL